MGENRENDTSEANFREDVITIQTPEDLGVTAKLAVGAGLDSGVDRHVLSPDLVCPDSGGEVGEAVVSDVGARRIEAVGLSEGAGAGIGEGDMQAVPLFESRAVARMGVDERRAGEGVRVERARERRRSAWGAKVAIGKSLAQDGGRAEEGGGAAGEGEEFAEATF